MLNDRVARRSPPILLDTGNEAAIPFDAEFEVL